tara:strand:- start:327 stop:1169 length:843 start_codon:yes stop_codon:yes gene_type:complete
MKLIVLTLLFTVSTNVWAVSDDETEDAGTEQAATESKALEILEEGAEEDAPGKGADLDALLHNARNELNEPAEQWPPSSLMDLGDEPSGTDEELDPEKELPATNSGSISAPQKAGPPGKKVRSSNGNRWETDYQAGRRLSKRGFTMGGVGLGMVVGGAAIALSSDGWDDSRVAAGALLALGGGGAFWGGAGVSAWGATKSHSALARGNIVNRGCVGCIGAWATAIYPGTTPVSYVVSFVQMEVDRSKYEKAVRYGPVSSTIRLAPVFGRTGTGLSVKGAF